MMIVVMMLKIVCRKKVRSGNAKDGTIFVDILNLGHFLDAFSRLVRLVDVDNVIVEDAVAGI